MSSISVSTETVRQAAPDDRDRLAATLAAAFFADPVMSWCYPDPERRAVLLPECFRAVLNATIPYGGVDTVADEVAGAVWVPPEAALDDVALGAELGRISAEYAERVFTLFELLDAHHPVHQPHQYLFILGARPEHQGKGLGSALLRSVLPRCDREGVPAYLEASSERNQRLYARHGFDTTEVVTLPDGPPLFCMWRNPRRAP